MAIPLSKSIRNPFPCRSVRETATECAIEYISEALLTTSPLLTKFHPVLFFFFFSPERQFGNSDSMNVSMEVKAIVLGCYISRQAILYCLHLDHFLQIFITLIFLFFTDKTCCHNYCAMISFADKNIYCP